MGLQEQIAEAIVIAFDELGGDPQNAVNAAVRHDTVESWMQQETAVTAIAGGAEMAIPGLHALTIPAGISFLLHKMARISWGIGALKGAYIVETTNQSDLRNILTLWANGSYFNAHILEHVAISMDAFEYALSEDGNPQLQDRLAEATKLNVVVKTLQVLDEITTKFPADEHAQKMYRTITGVTDLPPMALSLRDDVDSIIMNQPMNRRISSKLALKLSARISARVPARLLVGFIPFAGAIVNAFFNAQTLGSMADSAKKYYDNTLTRESFGTVDVDDPASIAESDDA
jgi:hypothetical protein